MSPPLPRDYRRGDRVSDSQPINQNDFQPSNQSNLPSCVEGDCDCSDFSTQAQAQRVLDAFSGDPHVSMEMGIEWLVKVSHNLSEAHRLSSVVNDLDIKYR